MKKMRNAVLYSIILVLIFVAFSSVSSHYFEVFADNPTEKQINSTAVYILATHPGERGIVLLDNYMRLFGYKRVPNKVKIQYDAHAVPQYLNLSMYRYVYYGYPLKQKIFINFDWNNQNYESDPGQADQVGISWDSSKYHPIDDYYAAYDDNNNKTNSLMWLSATSTDTIYWGLYEKGFWRNGVDHGVGMVTLEANNSSISGTTNIFGKYLHIYDNGNVQFSIGFPNVFTVTYTSGNARSWSKAYTLYGGDN